ncbi:MAG: hypothetical protein H6713_26490 [Myxococcales bacterium]|nr:hypothetical protein [Myxococcales bacterium]
MFVLLLWLSLSPPAPASHDAPQRASPSTLRLLHGGSRAPESWLAATDDGLWLCWRAPTTNVEDDASECWSRVIAAPSRLAFDDEEEPADEDARGRVTPPPLPSAARAAFLDPTLLVLADPGGARWIVQRHDDRARPLAALGRDAPERARVIPLRRPESVSCSPTGQLPARLGERWRWLPAACESTEARVCLGRRPPRPRRPLGLAFSIGIELRTARRDGGDAVQIVELARDLELLVLARVEFDPLARRRARQAYAELRRAQGDARELPPAVASASALRRAELEALRASLCRAAGGPL